MTSRSVEHFNLSPRRWASVEEILEAIRFQCPTLGEPEITVSGRFQVTRSVRLCWSRRLTVEVRFEEQTDLPLQRWTARSRPAGQTRAVWRGGWSVVPIDADPKLSVALDSMTGHHPQPWSGPSSTAFVN